MVPLAAIRGGHLIGRVSAEDEEVLHLHGDSVWLDGMA